ncbi:MAG: hypothetical protein GF317_19685 [Candidatus Lokiarchaeota archaeon]|nr:hypothetical protein [Candidatus Lokiarchaeota archaeon]MBD3201719.1 hypothetical protein [Candidatus Lokiarchaeota archaeon]
MSILEKNGGDLLIESLYALNIDLKYIFGITGSEILRIYDALYRNGKDFGIRSIMVRHEQGGGHAADSFARVSGGLGVCLGTVGPGVTHMVPAVATAYADSIPLLVLGAQVGKMFDGMGMIQSSIDQIALMKPITKMQLSVEYPEEIPKVVKKAAETALEGRKGPVFIEFRETALVRTIKQKDFSFPNNIKIELDKYRIKGNKEDIKAAINLLKSSQKPMIIAGGGATASKASEQIQILSESYKIPVATTINGIGLMSRKNTTFLGSYLTASPYRKAIAEADLVLSIGCKWDYTVFYGCAPLWNQKQNIIQVDIDPKEIGKNRNVQVGILGDCKTVLGQLISSMNKEIFPSHIVRWHEWNNYLQNYHGVDKKAINEILNSKEDLMKPQELVLRVYDFFPENTIYTIDGGDIMVYSLTYANYRNRTPRSIIFPTAMGHLGVGIPYAIGARLAKPNNPVVCITGDGSTLFNIQELETAVRLELPIICVISNNNCWGMIKGNQKQFLEKRYIDVDLPPTNYAKIAESFGCYTENVNNRQELLQALENSFQSSIPSVIDVKTAFEPSPTIAMINMFKKSRGLYGSI